MLSFLSIHVPKTAGTHFAEILRQVYPDKVHFDYGTERDFVSVRSCDPAILADIDGFRTRTSAIHGHFHYLKYKDVFPDVPVVATLRHPVGRVISQYRHIALHGDPAVERHRQIMQGELDVVGFSKFRAIGNAQSIYLEGFAIEDMKLVLLHEHYDYGVKRFCELAGINPNKPSIRAVLKTAINSRKGLNWTGAAIPVNPDHRAEIAKNCAEDIALYEKATRLFSPI